MRFRKRPVIVEAEQFLQSTDRLPFMEGDDPVQFDEDNDRHYVQTLEGPLFVSHGDWIIRGVKGEYYPCKPDIFQATYEPAPPGPTPPPRPWNDKEYG